MRSAIVGMGQERATGGECDQNILYASMKNNKNQFYAYLAYAKILKIPNFYFFSRPRA